MRLKTDSKRQAILAAAQDVFRDHGYGGASMDQVAARAGGSKATLYRYFPSKADLFLAVLLEGAVERASALFDALDPTADLAAGLRRFGARYLALTLAPDTLALRRVLIAEGARAGVGQRLYDEGPRLTWGKMAAHLAAAMDDGRLRRADPWIVAMHLRGLLEADLVNRALLGAPVDAAPAALRAQARAAVDVLTRAYEVGK
ncbi:MAG: TetR/AcrR family transcriptional regulator [Caulobacteraceae bacterium]